MNSSIKTIKSVSTTQFEVALCELPNGKYVVAYQTALSEQPVMGEPVTDYKTADFMYELKKKELEGH